MPKFRDLTGQKFNRLTVLHRVPNPKYTRWLCLCDCGNKIEVMSTHIISGNIKSCGCWKREQTIKRETKHGLHHVREYITWQAIKSRCNNPKNDHYQSYGGRNIKVCPEWENDFARFFKDMGPKPTPKHSIDRIDNDKGYSPDNCRWATRDEQIINRRDTLFLTHNDDTKTVIEWSKITKISYNTLKKRLALGWSAEKALSLIDGRKSRNKNK